MFFRQGEYNPGSRGGQELIAHELTHVVQQNEGVVQRSQNQKKLTSLVQENIISPRIQCWVLPPDWLDYIGLTIDVAERIYIELGYKEGEEKDFKRFVNNLFTAIDLIFATLQKKIVLMKEGRNLIFILNIWRIKKESRGFRKDLI